MQQIYFTTPIYYVNARPHLGHSYTTILGDVLKKHFVQRGMKVTYLTGTDEHGEKIEQIAKKEGRSPREYVDEIAADFKETWKKLEIDFDIFYRTSAPEHYKKVQHALQTLKDKGDIVFREYEGNYCVGCERFLTDQELTEKGLCPDHLTKPEPRKEANYFFLMSKYQDKLIAHIESHPEFIQPSHFRNEVLSFLKQPLTDLSISRPKSRLQWGIELPFDPKHVTYVWFDALLNYLNAVGWPDALDEAKWKSTHHLIAKDILKPHGVYWPTMLMALDVPLYKSLYVSGYWLRGESKMSKSLGNVIRPLEMEEKYGRETLRFFLLREMSYGLDSSFTLEGYVQAVNAYLANGIGNLASRVMTLAAKNFKGSFAEKDLTDLDRVTLSEREITLKKWNEGFSELKFQNAMKAWGDLVTRADLYINETKPWALAKSAAAGDTLAMDRLQVVMGVSLQLLEAIAILIWPVLPRASSELLRTLGLETGKVPDLAGVTGQRFSYALPGEVPKLFMRVQMPTEAEV